MIRFFRSEDLFRNLGDVQSSQIVELFDPKTEESQGTCCLQILQDNALKKKTLGWGITRRVAKVVSGGQRDEVVEIYYTAHEGLGCFDTFPLKEGLRDKLVRQLTELAQAQMYLIPG